jgi:cytoskeletal protein CcmA (bactofilin family)
MRWHWILKRLGQLRVRIAAVADRLTALLSGYLHARFRRTEVQSSASQVPLVSDLEGASRTLEPTEAPGVGHLPIDIPTGSPALVELNQGPSVLGRATVLRGELSGNEDLLIKGKFEGKITLPDHCLTIGPSGHVKSEIHARAVVILGFVEGNISAGEKIEIRKTGQVIGDLLSAAVAIEEGAYFKGSLNLQREGPPAQPQAASAPSQRMTDK